MSALILRFMEATNMQQEKAAGTDKELPKETDGKQTQDAALSSADRIRELESDLKELTAWQALAVEKVETIFARHQQLQKDLRSARAAQNEAEAKLGVHKREADMAKADFKNLQQAFSKMEEEARRGREAASELEHCKKRLAELEAKNTSDQKEDPKAD